MTSNQTDRTDYRLRDLLRQDYRRLEQGPPTSWTGVVATTLTTADETSISEQELTAKELTEDFENSAEMEQLAAAIAELAKFQQEQECRCIEEQEREVERKRQQEALMKQ